MDLALVVNTTDKYSHIWDAWYRSYQKYWRHDIPVYWLNEEKDISYPFKQMKVNIQGIQKWTRKFRESIRLIPENYLLVVLEDLFFTDSFREGELEWIYGFQTSFDVDLVQIRGKSKHLVSHPTLYHPRLKEVNPLSPYLIAHQHGIWKKSFLSEILAVDEDPWTSEVAGTKRLQGRGGFNIYQYEKDWFVNVLRHGAVDPKYKHLL